MKYAADFRYLARRALAGRWGVAVIAGLLASLLGAIASKGPEIEFEFGDNGANVVIQIAGQDVYTSLGGWSEALAGVILGATAFILIAALIFVVAYFILGSVIAVGYARFNLNLVDNQREPEIARLFGYFPQWKTAAAAKLLRALYVFLGTLLLVIPGIIASYSYAMTDYILAEHPERTASEAIELSKRMMTGNRWRLFCLEISFSGWAILSALTLGIGELWLVPYKQAAKAAFYREVSGTERLNAPFDQVVDSE